MEEKITDLIRTSILSLCRHNYNDELEIDGIICISSLQSKNRHVVKIHQQLDSNFHNPNVFNNDKHDQPTGDAVNKTSWLNNEKSVNSEKPSAGKIRARKKARKTEDDPDFNCNISNSSETFPAIVEQLKRKRKTRKVSNYAESSSEESDSVEDISDGEDVRYKISDQAPSLDENMGSASVLLKLLASPHKKGVAHLQYDPRIEMVNDERGSMSDFNKFTKSNENLLKQDNQNSDKSDKGINNVGQNIKVKEEPLWDVDYHNQANPIPKADQIQGSSNQSTGEFTQSEERGDNQKQGGQSEEKTDPNTEKNSILMKILEGKSLREAYSSENRSPSISKEAYEDFKQRAKQIENENSLLFRLPFVSFQDLFPQNSQGVLQNDNNNAKNKKQPLTLQTLDYANSSSPSAPDYHPHHSPSPPRFLSRGMKGSSSANQKYSTRLSSGKKDPVSYQEMLGFVCYSSEEEKDQGEIDSTDRVYTPPLSDYQMLSQDLEIPVPEVKTGAKRRKMGPRCKINSDSNTSTLSNVKSKPTVICNNRFECSICGRVFTNRSLRDLHEDAERAERFFKCPLCDGFFGSEESKLNHMQDRHGVLPESALVPKTSKLTGNKKARSTKSKTADETNAYFVIEKDNKSSQLKETREKSNVEKLEKEKYVSAEREKFNNVEIKQEIESDSEISQSEENSVPPNDQALMESEDAAVERARMETQNTEPLEMRIKQEQVDNDTFTCEMCEMVFLNETDKGAHIKIYHGAA